MAYIKERAKTLYWGKTTNNEEYPALDFLARLIVQIPTPGEQVVRTHSWMREMRLLRRSLDDKRNIPLSSRGSARQIRTHEPPPLSLS